MTDGLAHPTVRLLVRGVLLLALNCWLQGLDLNLREGATTGGYTDHRNVPLRSSKK